MKQKSSRQKISRKTAESADPQVASNSHAASLSPPEYGVGFVDQGQKGAVEVPGGGVIIQAQLKVSGSDDPSEREASRIARQVADQSSGGTAPAVANANPVQIQRIGGGDGFTAPSQVETGIKQARGGGQSLSEEIQTNMGGALNTDFSGVRIHTDNRASEMSRIIQAKAFTSGNDVFFDSGEYNPETKGGKELLAHELTHTAQQTGGSTTSQNSNVIQRVWKENLRGFIHKWLGKVPNHEDERWYYDEQIQPYEFWFTVPKSLAIKGRYAQFAGKEQMRDRAGWVKAGFKDVMKHIDPDKESNWVQPEVPEVVDEEEEDRTADFQMENLMYPLPGQQSKDIGGPQEILSNVYSVHPGHRSKKIIPFIGSQRHLKSKSKKEAARQRHFGRTDWRGYEATEEDLANFDYAADRLSAMDAEDKRRVRAAKKGKVPKHLVKTYQDRYNQDVKKNTKNISIKELEAIAGYTGGLFFQLNPRARRYNTFGVDRTYMKVLSSGLAKLPPYLGTVYRGIDFAKIWDYKVGEITNENYPMSTTREPNVTRGFGSGTLYVITPKGGGKHMKFASWKPSEDEVLFPPGTRFMIDDIKCLYAGMTSDDVFYERVQKSASDYDAERWGNSGKGIIVWMTEVPKESTKDDFEAEKTGMSQKQTEENKKEIEAQKKEAMKGKEIIDIETEWKGREDLFLNEIQIQDLVEMAEDGPVEPGSLKSYEEWLRATFANPDVWDGDEKLPKGKKLAPIPKSPLPKRKRQGPKRKGQHQKKLKSLMEKEASQKNLELSLKKLELQLIRSASPKEQYDLQKKIRESGDELEIRGLLEEARSGPFEPGALGGYEQWLRATYAESREKDFGGGAPLGGKDLPPPLLNTPDIKEANKGPNKDKRSKLTHYQPEEYPGPEDRLNWEAPLMYLGGSPHGLLPIPNLDGSLPDSMKKKKGDDI